MTAIGDILASLKSVILMQSDIENLRRDVDRLAGDLVGLKDFSHLLDKRLYGIEMMIGMKASNEPKPPLIEGN